MQSTVHPPDDVIREFDALPLHEVHLQICDVRNRLLVYHFRPEDRSVHAHHEGRPRERRLPLPLAEHAVVARAKVVMAVDNVEGISIL